MIYIGLRRDFCCSCDLLWEGTFPLCYADLPCGPSSFLGFYLGSSCPALELGMRQGTEGDSHDSIISAGVKRETQRKCATHPPYPLFLTKACFKSKVSDEEEKWLHPLLVNWVFLSLIIDNFVIPCQNV